MFRVPLLPRQMSMELLVLMVQPHPCRSWVSHDRVVMPDLREPYCELDARFMYDSVLTLVPLQKSIPL